MEPGWTFAFIILGIPVLGILSATFGAWLNYRHRRAALETLKIYAANGRDPPDALIRALTERVPKSHDGGWSGEEADREPAPEATTRQARAEFRMQGRHRYWNYKRSAEGAWRECFGWAGLAGGFWAAATYVATGKAQNSLLIVSYILAAVAIASLFGAILTTIARANDRQPG